MILSKFQNEISMYSDVGERFYTTKKRLQFFVLMRTSRCTLFNLRLDVLGVFCFDYITGYQIHNKVFTQ